MVCSVLVFVVVGDSAGLYSVREELITHSLLFMYLFIHCVTYCNLFHVTADVVNVVADFSRALLVRPIILLRCYFSYALRFCGVAVFVDVAICRPCCCCPIY